MCLDWAMQLSQGPLIAQDVCSITIHRDNRQIYTEMLFVFYYYLYGSEYETTSPLDRILGNVAR
jgi:hypothetical protein